MKAFDLIIVGAGFAGLACAEAAARHNLKTLVLERKHDVCGNIQTSGILVKELADEWDVPQRLTRKISGVRLYSPSLDWIDLSSPGYSFLATDTPALIQWQLQQAESVGARVSLDTPYTASRFVDGRHYLLGINRHFLIGIEAIYEPVVDIDQDKLHVFLDSMLAPGYIGWMVPGVHCIQVGLAARFPVAPRLRDFIHKIAPLVNLQDLQPVCHRAGVIPCGGQVNKRSDKNVMLLGDAAGMVSPLTGGGLHPAVRNGRIAGEAIAHYLDHDGDNPGAVVQDILPQMLFKHSLRSLYNRVTIPNTVFDAMLKTRAFRVLAQSVFFHHRGLLSPAAWRDLIRIFHHPR
jgi:digeranylgeranylglycerophospholipid reductase